MNGILLINKEKGITSRDVVNIAIKKLGIKKIGHTGTLDPIATGVMVLCIGKATKLVNLLTSEDKEYIAEVTLGIKTDTLDITGNILETKKTNIKKEELEKVIKSFKGKYNQEVPIYSAVKIKGKKLYEYARNKEEIALPKREVEIHNIELLDYNIDNKFTFKCTVSKGTYIRSLIKDICDKLGTIGSMSKLTRTKQGKFKIEDCINIDSISKEKIINIKQILDYKQIQVDDTLKFKIINGQIIENKYNEEKVLFIDNEDIIALYQEDIKDKTKLKPYIMLFERKE